MSAGYVECYCLNSCTGAEGEAAPFPSDAQENGMGNTLPRYLNKSLQMIFPRESETRPLPLTLLDLKCYPACTAFCLHCGIQCHINTQTTQSQDSLCLRDAPASHTRLWETEPFIYTLSPFMGRSQSSLDCALDPRCQEIPRGQAGRSVLGRKTIPAVL